ncbi:MAG: hypothetical protein V1798_01370 [Pseudomonadota bacterium]
MTHLLLDVLRVLAVQDQETRIRVPQIVKADLRKAGAAEHRIEAAVHHVPVVLGIPVPVREHQVNSALGADRLPLAEIGGKLV